VVRFNTENTPLFTALLRHC